MKNEVPSVNSWEQLMLVPPTVLDLTLRVGLILDSDYAQISIQMRESTTGRLLAMQSWPGLNLHDVDDRMRDAGREFTRLLLDATSPFTP